MIRRGVLMHIDTFVWNLEIPLAGIRLLELPSTWPSTGHCSDGCSLSVQRWSIPCFGVPFQQFSWLSRVATCWIPPTRDLNDLNGSMSFSCHWGRDFLKTLQPQSQTSSVCLLCDSFACFGQCSVSKVCSQRRLAQYAMFPGQVSGGQWTKTLEKHWLEGWTHVNSQHWSLRWQGVACYPGS